MRPVLDLQSALERAARMTEHQDPLGERIVSFVFAPPTAAVWKELSHSVGYLNARTGTEWDLFFVGVEAVAKSDPNESHRRPHWKFNARAFDEFEHEVYRMQANTLDRDGIRPTVAWRHTGGTDLVSILAHHGQPDWLSLVACRLDGNRDNDPVSLAEVAAGILGWNDRLAGDLRFIPGKGPSPVGGGISDLGVALPKVAAVLGAGVAGNAAYDLLTSLMAR